MKKRFSKRGQALVMVTIGLVAMFGVIGLAVDFGWMFFVRKNARSAADAAALAAARRAFASSPSGQFNCTVSCLPNEPCLSCQTNPCSALLGADTNLRNGCQYAMSHGFTADEVQMEANATPTFQTGTGEVNVFYWVTSTVTRQVPQLFSAVLGNPTGTVSARATAAILQSKVKASFIILNRENDPARLGPKDVFGADLVVQANDNQGQNALNVKGSIVMASSCNGSSVDINTNCTDGSKPTYAGMNQGGGTIKSMGTYVHGSGGTYSSPGADWVPDAIQKPQEVNDPLAGRGQPPAKTVWPANTDFAIQGGVISANSKRPDGTDICPAGRCPSGRYYAVDSNWLPTQAPLTFDGNVWMTNPSGADGWGEYVFYGGIKGNTGTTVTFHPGRYIYAGVAPKNGPGVLIDTATWFTLRDATDERGGNVYEKNLNDAGVLFVFTNGTYDGRIPDAPAPSLATLPFGTVNIQAGAAGGGGGGGGGGNKLNYINLHGIKPDDPQVPQGPGELADFIKQGAPKGPALLFWWDQQNSRVEYSASGTPTGNQIGDVYYPHNPGFPDSPELNIQASPDIHLYGVIYQPRGAWTNLTAGGGYSGPLQIITGMFNLHANANLTLGVPTDPVTITIVALIQ